MKKSLSYLSFVTAIALFSGCGSSGTTTETNIDTTAPEFTNTTYEFTVEEGSDQIVPLLADDSGATFSESSDKATISNSTLTFNAPLVMADEDFNVTVGAVDLAGNSSTKIFTFKVTDVPEVPTYAYVAAVGDKNFVDISAANNKSRLKVDESPLTWADEDYNDRNYTDAVNHCISLGEGFRIATRDEIFNTIDYTMDVNNTTSLLDNDFNISRESLISVVWVLAKGSDKYFINYVNGADVVDYNASAEHNVRCVKGSEISDHNFTTTQDNTVMDNITGLEWRMIADDNLSVSDATNACDGFGSDWELPTINELRTLFDYENNTLLEIVPANQSASISVWTSTSVSNLAISDNARHYLLQTKDETSSIVDEDTIEHPYTCVQRH